MIQMAGASLPAAIAVPGFAGKLFGCAGAETTIANALVIRI